jgi:dTDP-4-dehydrorhamnose reductase
MQPDNQTRRILLTGKDGQVGFELQRSLAPLGIVIAVGRRDCDLTKPEAIRGLVAAARPDIIVNAAAYTAVDKAEADADTAFAVNGIAPQVLADEASKRNALLIHYSTDYVFDGSNPDPYTEHDATAPLSVYGQTKLAGEGAVRGARCRYLILRTSWVFGVHGGNFLKTILRLAAERDSLRIVADQVGAPTSAALIADVTAKILVEHLRRERSGNPYDALPSGVYHLAAAGETSWHGYACYVVELARQLGMPLKLTADDIAPISTREYPLPAPRPANSRLNTEKLRSTFRVTLPDWQAGVSEVINQLARK